MDAEDAAIDDDVLTEFGDYVLLSEIARGGMGVVYRARQTSLNRLVAVKLILAGQLATKESLQRFRREAEAAAQLQHPGIVPIYEIGEFETQHFFSMELIDGSSLAQCLDEFVVDRRVGFAGQRDQQRCVAELMSRVARALEFAHQHGVLHRDLKPSNILIDQAGAPHLTDFGLAKLTGREASGLTLTHAVLGTPGYLAPEQAAGNLEVTTLADVYGLGATLYELLVGQPPFLGTSALDTMMQAIDQDPKSPRQISPTIHADLETIVLRCLEKQPEKRYPSAAAVADELDRFLRREPILARPISRWERTRRWCQRHPGVTLMAGVALLAVLVGMGTTWSQWYRATQANVRLRENLEHLQWDLIDDMLQDDEAAGALARIAALLRQNPHDSKAAMLAMSVLEQYRLPVPAMAPLRHANGAELTVARLSPDGSRIVTASIDGTARLWSSAEGEPLLEPLQHDGAVTWAEFSPDGRLLATCAADKTARLWEVATGRPARPPLRHDQTVERVHFSPNGKQLLSRTANSVTILDVASGEVILGPLDHKGRVAAARFVAGGADLFTAQQGVSETPVRVWDLQSGQIRLQLDTGPLSDADISADLSRVATVSGERCSIWDMSRGEKLNEFHSPSGRMVRVRFNRQGDKAAVVGYDHWVRVLSTASATALTPELPHTYLVNGLDFVGTGDRLATWADDATVCLWDSHTGELHAEPMRHPDRVQFAEAGVVDDGEVFLATVSHREFGPESFGAGTGAAQLWRLHPPRVPADRSREKAYCYESNTLSADGTLLALATDANEIWIMRTDSGESVCKPLQTKGAAWAMMFTPDAGRLIATTAGGQVAVWSLPSGDPVCEPREYPTTFQPAEMSSDGRFFATGSTDGCIRVWDAQACQPIWEQQHGSGINCVDFSPDGRLVASAGEDRISRIWDATTGALVHELKGHQNEVTRVDFSPDGRRLVSASQDFTARVWNVGSGEQLFVLPHQGELLDATFSPDGRRIATGSRDRTAVIWDAATGTPQGRPLAHLQTVRTVSFTADSQRLLTVDYFGPRLWDVASGHPLTTRLRQRMHAGDGFHTSSGSALFTPDGQSFFLSTCSPHAKLWHVPVPPTKIAAWFPDFLEAVAGLRFGVGVETPELVPPSRFLELQRQLQNSSETDFFSRWAREWLAECVAGNNP